MLCALQIGTKAPETVRYSSPCLLQTKDRCEVNFKDLYQINC